MVTAKSGTAKRPVGRPKKPRTEGERAIAWIQKYCHIPEGPDVGRQVRLRPWQQEILRDIYDNPVGTRRAILSFGRKNAKTALAALILLYHLCGEGLVENSHIYSAAQSRDQASILFGLAAKVVRLSPVLAAHVTIKDARKELEFKPAGTRYSALSAEAATAYGLSPVLVIHDELGQVRGPRSELYDALETATGAHAKPLSIIISTQAPHDGDLLSMLIDDALARNDPHTVIKLYTAATSIDPFSDEAILAANPAFGDFLNADEVRSMARNAKRMPAGEASYRNLVLNQRVSADKRFVPQMIWDACGAAPKLFNDKTEIYAGLDLSAVSDLTACVLIGKINEVWQVRPTFWLPHEGLPERSMTDRVPYDMWVNQGHIETMPGKAIDYEYVAKWLRELFERYNVIKVGFDNWRFDVLKSWLLRAGFNEDKIAAHFVAFGQGYKSMSPALDELSKVIVEGRMAHGNHPVLAMCANNAVVESDPAGNRKLNKAKSVRRIDGMVALAMAFGVLTEKVEVKPEPAYQMFVLT